MYWQCHTPMVSNSKCMVVHMQAQQKPAVVASMIADIDSPTSLSEARLPHTSAVSSWTGYAHRSSQPEAASSLSHAQNASQPEAATWAGNAAATCQHSDIPAWTGYAQSPSLHRSVASWVGYGQTPKQCPGHIPSQHGRVPSWAGHTHTPASAEGLSLPCFNMAAPHVVGCSLLAAKRTLQHK